MSYNNKIDEIYNLLKNHIEKNSQYNVEVKRNVIENKYPLVIFETNLNTDDYTTQDMYRLDRTRNLSFTISILAININNIDSSLICDELEGLVFDIMQGYYLMQGGTDARLKNINTAKATKYVLHFSYNWNVKSNIVYL